MRISASRCSLPFFALFLALPPYTSGDQAQSQPDQSPNVIRSNTRLVILDVVATDNSGNPVTDLAEKDFTVLESGRPQRIGSFSFQNSGMAVEQPVQLPPHRITNAPRRGSPTPQVILLERHNGGSNRPIQSHDRLWKGLEKR